MEKKITKKQVFEAIKKYLVETDADVEAVAGISTEDVVGVLDNAMAQLDAKAEKARERAEEKKAKGDALRTEIEALLTNEFQTADDITAQIDAEDVTKAKVVARLTQLVTAEVAEKEQVKTEDGRKLMAYRIKQGEAETAEADEE